MSRSTDATNLGGDSTIPLDGSIIGPTIEQMKKGMSVEVLNARELDGGIAEGSGGTVVRGGAFFGTHIREAIDLLRRDKVV